MRIAQPLEQLCVAALVRPGRDDAAEIVVAAGIRIDVGLHVHAPAPRLLDQREDLAHLAPVFFVRDLHVDDVHRQPRLLADGDRLLDRIEHPEPFVADVGGINPAVGRRDARERHEIRGGGQRTRRHQQRGRQAERAVAHRFADEFLHPVDLGRGGPIERAAHDAFPDLPLAHVGPHIHSHAGFLDRGEVIAQGANLDRPTLHGLAVRGHLILKRTRGDRFAEDLGGDALADLPRRAAVLEEQPVRMRVDVDEAGGHHESGRVDLAAAGAGYAPDRRDAIAADRDIALDPRVARTIDDPAAAYDEVEFRLGRRSERRTAADEHTEPERAQEKHLHGVPQRGAEPRLAASALATGCDWRKTISNHLRPKRRWPQKGARGAKIGDGWERRFRLRAFVFCGGAVSLRPPRHFDHTWDAASCAPATFAVGCAPTMPSFRGFPSRLRVTLRQISQGRA